MMVETMLESSQDFGMASGSLPQWKRELLQRRAARRPAPPPAPPPPPPPPAADADDEELRYGPGIVKRLKSRYLSLALRDAPRRRPSVLRRAASLEHLLDAPAPPTAPRPPRPASLAAPAPAPRAAPRRDFVKRARSVDALSRLESRAEPSPPPSPPPLPPQPRPSVPRSARPPRRPAPLLRDAERPPLDVVRTALRKFEPAPQRRTHPLVQPPPPSTPPPLPPTPEPRASSPNPPSSPPAITVDEVEGPAASSPRPVTRAALEGIARAGSSTRYAFETPRRGAHLPPLAATNPVLLGRARRVGVIRPMPSPARATSTPVPAPLDSKLVDEPRPEPAPAEPPAPSPPPRLATPPPPAEPETPAPSRCPERRETPPSAMVEPIPRSPPEERPPTPPPAEPVAPAPAKPAPRPEIAAKPKPLMNGHADPPRVSEAEPKPSRIGAADTERAWSGGRPAAPWAGTRRARPAPATATSVVFNFSGRKEVPDYIENDGLVLRASRRDRIKPGEPGVVVLRPEALRADSESDPEEERPLSPPAPCTLRFVNDNVLINGRSSLQQKQPKDPHRVAKLKLQFDDSLTRTFEYPSETSLCDCDDAPPPPVTPPLAPPVAPPLTANTHIVSAALARYTPHKTCADAFQLGLAPPQHAHAECGGAEGGGGGENGGTEEGAGDARPCGADARSWSDARALHTDLLF